jgi:chromosome segregation protein
LRLKHLELQGYKTFAGKAEFVFPTGITAIVGPNGSGKSNIADGVRWVLGEQSYSVLRGKRTEDMIFAGSEQRPRAGMAEVFLTLDNSDGWLPVEFSEVVIGRRAYRSGENEYLLNGSRVRLKDVTELLGASGLARRTYTVIGQGLVDQALSLRPEERRTLFEEAAGIAHYQSKRDEALRKLDETQRNLERARDILTEIGPRLRALQRQSERSQQYERLAGELRDLQRTWYGYHWGRAQQTLHVARQTADAQMAVLNEHQQELDMLGDRLNQLHDEQAALRTRLVEWQRQSAALHSQAEAVQRDLAVMTERARSLKQQQAELESEMVPLQDQRAAQVERVTQAEAELAALSTRLARYQADMTAAQSVLAQRQTERQNIAEARRDAEDRAFKFASEASDRRNRRGQLAERKADLERQRAEHAAEQAKLQAEIEDQRQTIAEVEADIAALVTQGNTLKVQAEAKAAAIAACQSRVSALDEELVQASAAETELRARYEALGQVRTDMVGFDAGARAVLAAKLPGVRGAIASLISVDAEWERAIEAALGADVQAIIADDWSVVESVSGQKVGRATVLPLGALRELSEQRQRKQREMAEQQQRTQRLQAERRLRKQREMIERRRRERRELIERQQREMNEARLWWRKLVDRLFGRHPLPAEFNADIELDDILSIEQDASLPAKNSMDSKSVGQISSLPYASSIVACDDAIRPAVKALLGDALLADDLTTAYRLLPDLPPGLRIVTRAGEVLRHSGSVTVGATNGGGAGSTGLLSREREWRELASQVAAAQQHTAQVEAARDREAGRQAMLERERAGILRSLDELSRHTRSRTQERDVLARAAERLDQQITWQTTLIQQTQSELDQLLEKDQALAAELQVLTAKQTEAETEIRAADTRFAALPLEEISAQVTQIKTSAAVASQAVQGQQAIAHNERNALAQVESQIAGRTARAAQLSRESIELEADLEAQQARATEFTAQIAELDMRLRPAESELARLEAEQQILVEQERTARARLHELESHHNAAVLEAARREDELNNLHSRIDEDLGLVEMEMGEATGPVPLPLKPIVEELPIVAELPEGIETGIQRRKAQLHRIGPISPEVQAEFKETQERHAFLTTQSADLEKAITSLNQVIAELDELMRKAFVETFRAIAEEFKNTFNQLFGGGTAKMVLTDPDNITMTGVDIIARPPGKRQQGLALLSGGERTLTAAALLFAILKVRPTPFCFLDEVDAALDEANVGRFRDILRELSASTQFVVITHNRGTVEAADTIYGITMSTDSASRALSLKLEGEVLNTAA